MLSNVLTSVKSASAASRTGQRVMSATSSVRVRAAPPKRLHLVLRPYSGPIGNKLIPTVNKLQEIFAMTGTELDLPQIVVVGAQSSGKSSVLENLVGRDFLPRGSGIVTRRPLILQLIQTSASERREEWAEFAHKAGIRYTNFEDIRAEISAETDRVAGKNLGVVDKPILLKIHSPNVVNLTLVDLPGIARNPVGDQPADIEARIIQMIRKYAEKSNAIILAVQAANQDVATSDAVKLANQVDPGHQRTVGVLTKIDLMDKGTDAMPILIGDEMPLVHGWVPIISRSQQDIVRGKSIADALRDEVKWFEDSPIYHAIAPQAGTAQLAIKCNRLLTSHIRRTLPELKAVIQAKIKATKAELEMYGDPVPRDPAAAGPYLLSLINKFALEYKNSMEGGGPNMEIQTKDLNGGARIRYILDEIFASKLGEIHPLTGLSTTDVRTAVRNAAGTRSALLVPDQAFEQLVKRQISLFREPALETAELVYNELTHVLATMPMNELVRYRRLREKVTEVSTKALKAKLKEVNQLIDVMVGLEVGFINTSHPDFIGFNVLDKNANSSSADERLAQADAPKSSSGGGGFLSFLFGGSSSSEKPKKTAPTQPSPFSPHSGPESSSYQSSSSPSSNKRAALNMRIDDKAMSEHERVQVRTVVNLLDSYMNISKKSIQDVVIKVVMCKLVNETREALQRELTAALYQPHLLAELLRESEDIEGKRIAARENLERFKAAKRAIQEADDGLWDQL